MIHQGLPEPDLREMPVEVSETLILAREQMKAIPAAIEDVSAARRDFAILDLAIDRLVAVADEAARLDPQDQAGRDEREAELGRLAAIVARVAGRRAYSGPKLSVLSPAQAEAARKTLRHLTPVKAVLAAELADQEHLILDAVGQTIDFLEQVAALYPEAVSLASLPELLRRVKRDQTAPPASILEDAARVHGWH
jgi:hypothetical protein